MRRFSRDASNIAYAFQLGRQDMVTWSTGDVWSSRNSVARIPFVIAETSSEVVKRARELHAIATSARYAKARSHPAREVYLY